MGQTLEGPERMSLLSWKGKWWCIDLKSSEIPPETNVLCSRKACSLASQCPAVSRIGRVCVAEPQQYHRLWDRGICTAKVLQRSLVAFWDGLITLSPSIFNIPNYRQTGVSTLLG